MCWYGPNSAAPGPRALHVCSVRDAPPKAEVELYPHSTSSCPNTRAHIANTYSILSSCELNNSNEGTYLKIVILSVDGYCLSCGLADRGPIVGFSICSCISGSSRLDLLLLLLTTINFPSHYDVFRSLIISSSGGGNQPRAPTQTDPSTPAKWANCTGETSRTCFVITSHGLSSVFLFLRSGKSTSDLLMKIKTAIMELQAGTPANLKVLLKDLCSDVGTLDERVMTNKDDIAALVE